MTNAISANRTPDRTHAATVCKHRQDRPGTSGPQASGEGAPPRPAERLRELGVDLMHAARRAACIPAADDIAWPVLCRQALQTVELCRRAAELAARR